MKLDNAFSIKDYFNYYFAGLIWTLDFVFLFLLISGNWEFNDILSDLKNYSDVLGIVPSSIMILVIPFVLGFSLSPLGENIKKKWREINRLKFADPKKFILYHNGAELKGKQIPKDEAESVKKNAKLLFDYSYNDKFHYMFFPIRAYVIEHGGEAKQLAIRARTLTNLTESLLLPVPIAFALLASLLLLPVNTCAVILIAILVGSLTHWLLVNRYFQLERYWVKHFYRAFLVMQNKSIQENSHDPS